MLALLVILFAIAFGAGAASFGAPLAGSLTVGAMAGLAILIYIFSDPYA
jgi:hypothetical protein